MQDHQKCRTWLNFCQKVTQQGTGAANRCMITQYICNLCSVFPPVITDKIVAISVLVPDKPPNSLIYPSDWTSWIIFIVLLVLETTLSHHQLHLHFFKHQLDFGWKFPAAFYTRLNVLCIREKCISAYSINCLNNFLCLLTCCTSVIIITGFIL